MNALQFKNDAEMEAFARKLVDAAETNTQLLEIIRFGRQSLARNPALLILILDLWSTKKDWPIWQLTYEVLEKCGLKLVAESDGAE